MKTLCFGIIGRSIPFLLVVVLSCDVNDSIEPENPVRFLQTEFYTVPGLSTMIDLDMVTKHSLVTGPLGISLNPVRGTLTKLVGGIFKYTPNADFNSGTDEFLISYFVDNGTQVRSAKITVHVSDTELDFPCGNYPVEDKVSLMGNLGRKVIHVLNNDRSCGSTGTAQISIRVPPKFGNTVVAGDSIMYQPGPNFSVDDEFVYGLSTTDGEEISLGLVSIIYSSAPKFEELDPFYTYDIFFVDDRVGYAKTLNGVLKTVDGGTRWIPTGPISDDYEIGELFFINENEGFGVISKCEWWGEFCVGGWTRTTDGGRSWKNFYMDDLVTSIYFTSSQTGFISTLLDDTDYDGVRDYAIYRTINGGEDWKEVFSTPTINRDLRIRFVNDMVGYAYDETAIFKTTDGGKVWEKNINYDGHVSSFAIVDEKTACATFSTFSSSHIANTPSVIMLSEDGSEWNPVRNLPYKILALGFSPDGNLGLAIGVSGYLEGGLQPVTISASRDKGRTWTDLMTNLQGYPFEISVPSAEVAYIMGTEKIIKFTP